MVHLIGPGGAGKSTIGRLIADQLKWRFNDLDRLFEERHGNIDDVIRIHGYATYARWNVETYRGVPSNDTSVFALSSGFMTYPDGTHPELSAIRRFIEMQPSTLVLLPALEIEACVRETVRRQRERPLAQRRPSEREDAVIRARFPIYLSLSARKISTHGPPMEVAAEIIRVLGFG